MNLMANNSPALGFMVAPIVPVVETEAHSKDMKCVWHQLPGQMSLSPVLPGK